MLTSFLWSVIGPEKLHIYSVAFCLPNFLPNAHKIGAFWVILKSFLNFKIPHWDRNSQQNRNFRKFHIIFNQTFLFRGYGDPVAHLSICTTSMIRITFDLTVLSTSHFITFIYRKTFIIVVCKC